ncbi:MAG: hypothetical protein ACLR06_17765 [Christensenellaceae bacterium]
MTARPTEMRTYIPAPWGGETAAEPTGGRQRRRATSCEAREAKIKSRRAVFLEEFRACRGILHGLDFGKKFRF